MQATIISPIHKTSFTSILPWEGKSLGYIIPLLKGMRAFVPWVWIIMGRLCSKLNRQIKTLQPECPKGKCNSQCCNCLHIYICTPFISSFLLFTNTAIQQGCHKIFIGLLLTYSTQDTMHKSPKLFFSLCQSEENWKIYLKWSSNRMRIFPWAT